MCTHVLDVECIFLYIKGKNSILGQLACLSIKEKIAKCAYKMMKNIGLEHIRRVPNSKQ